MAKLDTAPLALQWGRTEMGEFYIRISLPIQVEGHQGYGGILGFTLSEEDFEKLKADVNAPRGLTIAKSLPKPNGHRLIERG